MKRQIILSIIMLSGLGAYAQDPETGYLTEAIITPHFFITVIAGVILALGFQFILTALSVATGISAIGDVKKSYVQGKNHSAGKHYFGESNDENEDDTTGSTGVKVTVGFGIWSTLTVAISLFAATALALNLSLIATPMVGVTLALVIWATFFILLFYLESKVVNTLIGGLINTATAGLRSSAEAVKGIFASSKEQKLRDMADHTIEKVRSEFQSPIDENTLNETIDEFFDKFDRKVPDYKMIKQDIEEIVNNSVEKSNEQNSGQSSPAKWMAVQNVISSAIDASSVDSSSDESKSQQLKQLQAELKDAYKQGESQEEKAKNIVTKLTPAEEEQVDDYMNKIKNVLSSEDSSSMSTEDLKVKINDILDNPEVEANKIGSKLKQMDRDQIVIYLSENTSLSRMEVEKYADKIEKVLRKLQLELSGNTENTDLTDFKAKIENVISQIGGSNGRDSDLDLSGLGSLFQAKMEGKKEDIQTLKKRLQNADREELVAMVTQNTRIDRKDIDKVVNTIEESKNKVLERINKIENKAREKMKILERKAVIQAEHTRKTAASAAWWLVISALISAGAAIGGSLVTLF